MKIALVTETFPPEVNGVAMTLRRLVGGLVTMGDAVTVVRPRQKADVEREARGEPSPALEGGYRDWLVPGMALPKYEGLMMGLPVPERLRRGWSDERPDIVHIATEGPLGWSALAAAARLGLPVSSSFHTNFHQYGDHYGYGAARDVAMGYLKAFHNATAVTMVPTRQMRGMLAAEGYRNVTVVSRGVDTVIFSPEKRSESLRAAFGAKGDAPVALYVGRLAREKNIDLAVAAFLRIRERHPDAKFVLVGDGPERPALEAKYPEFYFAGMQHGESLAAHYASGDIFLFPSVTETFGNVVTEALASGLVVVTYAYAAGLEHIRHGQNGLLARFGDPEDFVRVALAAASSPGKWPAWRAAARETARSVTWEAIVRRFRDVLEAVVAAGREAETGIL